MQSKRFCIGLILIFLFTFSSPFLSLAAGEQENSIPELPREAPHIIISNDRWMPEFKAGEKGSLSIPLENTSSTPAKNVEVSLGVGDLDKFPFQSDKMSFTRYITYLSDRSLVSFNVTVPMNAKPGTYGIPVSISYSSDYAGGGSASATVYVKIINEYKQPALKLMDVAFEGEKLASGQSHFINLKMKNESDLNLKDIQLSLSGFSPNGINMDKWPDVQNIRTMKARELNLVVYKIRIDPEMKSGTYPLDLAMKYKDEYDREYTGESKVYLPIAGKDDQNDTLSPRIIIENYDFGGSHVEAGKIFTMTLLLRNTSETLDVKNIKVSLNSDGQVFAPVGSSNSFYIAGIKPNGVVEKTLRFRPKPTAEVQIYSINAEIDYQDKKGNKYNEKELISIPLIQELSLRTGDVELPGEVFVDTPTGISIDYFNTSKGIIRNLSISTEGDFEVQNGDVFVGNLESGKSDYYDLTIIPKKEGNLKGSILFDFDDDLGQHFQIKRDFEITAVQPEAPPMEGPPEGMQAEKKFAFKKWMIPAGAAIVAGITGLVIFRRRQRRKMEEIDLDE